MPTRLLGQTKNKPKRALAPTRRDDWKQLLRKAITRAEATQDRRLAGLKQALVKDQAEQYLRRTGIIAERDLEREFPVKKP
jgi:hypothetical protein